MDLKVLTLNVMHARMKGRTSLPLAIRKKDVLENLKTISTLLQHEQADLIFLQEIDAVKEWSEGVPHVDILGRLGKYPYRHHVGHSFFQGGTAILSRYPLERMQSIRFDITFPIPRKGAVSADVVLPDGRKVTAISAHLVLIDFLRKHSRAAQSQMLVEAFRENPHPIIIAGDFNTDIKRAQKRKEKTFSALLDELKLHVFEANSHRHHTFPAWDPKRRIDWVLVSQGITFREHRVLTNTGSDHAGVVAMLDV